MHIVDNEGNRIEITNLDAAIEQAGAFRYNKHINPEFAKLDNILNRYWDDVYEQLIQLKK